jgi:hypothetical protein
LRSSIEVALLPFLVPWYNVVMANQHTLEWPDRFWSKVTKTDTCWNWSAGLDSSGYGVIRYLNKNKKAHRVSYLMEYGDFDESLLVLHKCDTPSCVRPDHLFLGSQSDNMTDMVVKGRHGAGSQSLPSFEEFSKIIPKRKVSSTCRNGHEYTKENTRLKLIKKRVIRVCRSCQRFSAKKDLIKYKVSGFVRGIENRQEVVSGLVDKINKSGVVCWYCQGPFECLDHFIPKFLGGPISVENINPSCNECNQKRKSFYA